jgi:hypothetical protein
MFWIGVICVGHWTIAYITLMEFLPKDHQKIAGPLIHAFGGTTAFPTGALICYLTQSTYVIQAIMLAVNFILILVLLFVIPESPHFLYEKCKFDDLRSVLDYMAHFNGINNMKILKSKFQKEVKEELETQKKPEIKFTDFWQDKLLRKTLLILIVQWVTINYAYNMMSFSLKYLEGDIYRNVIAISSAEMMSKLLSSVFLVKLGLICLYNSSYSIAFVGSLCLVIFSNAS